MPPHIIPVTVLLGMVAVASAATASQVGVAIAIVAMSGALWIALRSPRAIAPIPPAAATLALAAPIPMYQKDAGGRFVEVNAAFLAFCGRTREAVVGRFAHEIPGLAASARLDELEGSLLAGQRDTAETTERWTRADGVDATVIVSVRALRDAAGVVSGTVASLIDIEDRLQSAQQIRDQKDRLDLVIEASQSGIFDAELPTGKAYFSPQLSQMLRLDESADLPQADDFEHWVHPDDWRRVHAAMIAHLSRQTPRLEIAYRHRRGDGTYMHAQVHAIASFDTRGRAIRMTGSVVDNDAQHEAAQAAAARQALLHDLIELNPNPIFMKTASGVWEVVNRAWEDLAGHSRADVIGHTSRHFQPPELADQTERQDAELLASDNRMSQQQVTIKNTRGEQHETIITTRVLCGAEGEPEHIIGVITDITERLTLERRLELQTARLDLVIEASQHGIWDRDLDNDDFYCTPRFKEILGYTPDADMSGYHIGPALHPDDHDRVLAARDAYLRGETTRFDQEFRRMRPDGDYVWIRSRGLILDSPLGRRFVGSIIDTTPERAREAALKDANQRAQEGAQTKAAFLSTMSHEMRTPLNGVLGASSLLATTPLNDEQKRFLDAIQSSGELLLALISDILDFSKIESGRVELEHHPIDLQRHIDAAFDIVGTAAREKQIDLLSSIAGDVPRTVIGDEVRLRQVLLNLVGNAVKFTPTGFVRVSVSRLPTASQAPEEVRLMFTIEDTGIGVPDEARAKLFEPFRQGDASINRKYGGSGLGLAISRRLVSIMGGDMWLANRNSASSTARIGATFCYTVTLRASHPEVPSIVVQPLEGKRVLLIQAQLDASRHFADVLRSWGTHVTEAANPQSALPLLTAGRFDVVLTDFDSAASGIAALASELRARHPGVGLIALTHTPLASVQAVVGLDPGTFDGYVLKPASRSQLLECVQRLFSSRADGFSDTDLALETTYHADSTSSSTILVAEDNPINQIIAREMLKRLGFACEIVHNGQEAVSAVLAGDYAVLLMDVQMPLLNGKDAARQIVAARAPSQRPIIVALTAHALSGDREECLAAGMDDYVSKPLKLEKLSTAVSRAFELRRVRQRSANSLEAMPPMRPSSASVAPAGPTDAANGDLLDEQQLSELSTLTNDAGEAMLARLVERHRERCATAFALLNALVAEPPNPAAFGRIAAEAHDLRGLSATLGACELAAMLQRVEASARAMKHEPLRDEIARSEALAKLSEAALATYVAGQTTRN